MKLYQIRQKFSGEEITNIKKSVREELQNSESIKQLEKGSKVAVTAGSRGIENIVKILRETITYLKEKELKPFIIPAMGSHGGATKEGQLEVLQHIGITEESVGAPIYSSMDVMKLGTTGDGLPVYIDKYAAQADGIIVVNRIKVHTAFKGKVESGLSKMITIGLGKQKGASFVHSQGADKMEHNILQVSNYALKHSKICIGLAIVENGYEQTSIIKGVDPENWHEEETKLLKKSKELMPALPIEDIDLLIVEEMGKCYSGTGMDPNIIGRWRIEGVPEPKVPNIKKIAVLDLAEKSHGNAQGIGLADFTTEKLVKKIDRKSTYMNAVTSTYLQRAMIPLTYEGEQETIESALKSLGPGIEINKVSLIQIANTLDLTNIFVSQVVIDKLNNKNADYEIVKEIELDYVNNELKYRLSNANIINH
ncbi:lactate racemase domain-containing protein [Virgibacillus xinjiangensis]|uniref:Lactate racemase domain-containing protein n=1 Tax=Virgibacillus xinjiangensis TaxID=393090 RepID=A0ABV7CYJ6_9BACI